MRREVGETGFGDGSCRFAQAASDHSPTRRWRIGADGTVFDPWQLPTALAGSSGSQAEDRNGGDAWIKESDCPRDLRAA